MATNTYRTFLMTSADGSQYTKLIDIISAPEMGSIPEQLDTTTLSDSATTSIGGIEQQETLEFSANYTKEDFKKLKEMEGKKGTKFALAFGGTGDGASLKPTGEDGAFKFEGELFVKADASEVNSVRKMTLTIFPSTSVKFEDTPNLGGGA